MSAIRFLDQLILMISQNLLPTEPIRCPILLMHYCPRLPVDGALPQLPLEWTMLLEQSSMVRPAKDNTSVNVFSLYDGLSVIVGTYFINFESLRFRLFLDKSVESRH